MTLRSFVVLARFIGANDNTIRWFAASKVFPGFDYLTTTYTFDTAGSEVPIGPLRVFQYLDGDVGEPDGNIFRIIQSNTTPRLLTLDSNIGLFGVEHYGVPRGNFTFAGSAVDRFDRIQQQIIGAGQPVSIGEPINLPSFMRSGIVFYGPANIVSTNAWDVTPGARGAFVETFLRGVRPPPPGSFPSDDECFIEEEGDTCEGPVVPVRRQFSCQGTKCKIEIACNLTTECASKVELFVTPPSTRLRDTPPEVSRRIKFASGVANIPPGATAIVRPKLTKRGKAISRANKKRTVRGVMAITNVVSGNLVTLVPVRIKLR